MPTTIPQFDILKKYNFNSTDILKLQDTIKIYYSKKSLISVSLDLDSIIRINNLSKYLSSEEMFFVPFYKILKKLIEDKLDLMFNMYEKALYSNTFLSTVSNIPLTLTTYGTVFYYRIYIFNNKFVLCKFDNYFRLLDKKILKPKNILGFSQKKVILLNNKNLNIYEGVILLKIDETLREISIFEISEDKKSEISKIEIILKNFKIDTIKHIEDNLHTSKTIKKKYIGTKILFKTLVYVKKGYKKYKKLL